MTSPPASTDRRQVLRVASHLPFAWQMLPDGGDCDSVETAMRCFNLDSGIERDAQRRRLDDELASALSNVADASLRHVLTLLNHKLDLVFRRAPAIEQPLATTAIGLSVDGVDFATPTLIAPDSTLAILFALPPEELPFCATARVLRVVPEGDGYRCAAQFIASDVRAQKALARFVMREHRSVTLNSLAAKR